MSTPVLMNPTYPILVPDISLYQNFAANGAPSRIDFMKVAGNRAVRALMVKASEGSWTGYPDALAVDQMNAAHAAGLPVIPYHYWHFEAPPADQARRFKAVFSQAAFTPKRFMVDIEDAAHDTTRPPNKTLVEAELPAWTTKARAIAVAVRDCLDAVSQVCGVAPLWYGAEWFQGWWVWLAQLSGMDMAWVKRYPLHCASYTAPWMYLCTGFTLEQTLFWQWTSTPPEKYWLNGFPWPQKLDLNFWLRSEAEFYEWIGMGPPAGKPAPEDFLASLAVQIADYLKGKK